jgi:DNA-binding LacI/PurR family transcriptional regulator
VTHGYHKDFSVVDLFTLEIMGGISRGLHELGYDMLVVHVDRGDQEWARSYLDSGRVAGFILMTSHHKQDHVHELTRINAPFIMWGIPNSDNCCSSICGDNLKGGLLATQYLINQGRKRIAFIGGPVYEREMELRLEGYQEAISSAHQVYDGPLVEHGDFSPSSGFNAMKKLITTSPDLDAVVVASDLMAIGAIRAIQEQHRAIPDDVAVIGYDDLSIATLSTPPLTTIRQNIPDAGTLLARGIVDLIKTGKTRSQTLPVELVIRGSA